MEGIYNKPLTRVTSEVVDVFLLLLLLIPYSYFKTLLPFMVSYGVSGLLKGSVLLMNSDEL